MKRKGSDFVLKNKKVKMAMAEAGIKQWELALLLGMHEGTLSRKFRNELSAEEQDRMVEAIYKQEASRKAEERENG